MTAADPSAYLLRTARENMQLLSNKLYELFTSSTDKKMIVLPPPTTHLPREKPLPEAKPLTRWEKFAKEKGIVKKKRSKMVWDEEKQQWAPRYGYGRANDPKDKMKDWLVMAKPGDDGSVDPFEAKADERKMRLSKQKKQEERNRLEAAHAASFKGAKGMHLDRTHWVSIGAVVKVDVYIAKAYAWASALKSVLTLMHAPAFPSFLVSELAKQGIQIKVEALRVLPLRVESKEPSGRTARTRPGQAMDARRDSRIGAGGAGAAATGAAAMTAALSGRTHVAAALSQSQSQWLQQHVVVVGAAAFCTAWFCIFILFVARWGRSPSGYQAIAASDAHGQGGTELPVSPAARSGSSTPAPEDAAAAAAVASFKSSYQPQRETAYGDSNLDQI